MRTLTPHETELRNKILELGPNAVVLAYALAHTLPRDAENDARDIPGPDCVIDARALFRKKRRKVKAQRAAARAELIAEIERQCRWRA